MKRMSLVSESEKTDMTTTKEAQPSEPGSGTQELDARVRTLPSTMNEVAPMNEQSARIPMVTVTITPALSTIASTRYLTIPMNMLLKLAFCMGSLHMLKDAHDPEHPGFTVPESHAEALARSHLTMSPDVYICAACGKRLKPASEQLNPPMGLRFQSRGPGKSSPATSADCHEAVFAWCESMKARCPSGTAAEQREVVAVLMSYTTPSSNWLLPEPHDPVGFWFEWLCFLHHAADEAGFTFS